MRKRIVNLNKIRLVVGKYGHGRYSHQTPVRLICNVICNNNLKRSSPDLKDNMVIYLNLWKI